jgi:hypothetical protein
MSTGSAVWFIGHLLSCSFVVKGFMCLDSSMITNSFDLRRKRSWEGYKHTNIYLELNLFMNGSIKMKVEPKEIMNLSKLFDLSHPRCYVIYSARFASDYSKGNPRLKMSFCCDCTK